MPGHRHRCVFIDDRDFALSTSPRVCRRPIAPFRRVQETCDDDVHDFRSDVLVLGVQCDDDVHDFVHVTLSLSLYLGFTQVVYGMLYLLVYYHQYSVFACERDRVPTDINLNEMLLVDDTKVV